MRNIRKRKLIKGTAAVLASILLINVGEASGFVSAAALDEKTTIINQKDTEDTYLYDSMDKVITTKTGVKRTIPKTTGNYDRSYYPIPLENEVPNEEIFTLIKEENKQLMGEVETNIQKGTLTKHIAADGQFYGSIADDVLGVEKKVYLNTNSKGAHTLASYVAAGEIATVTLSEVALSYAKKGLIKIGVGATMMDADGYELNHGTNNRMPYLGKTFSICEKETKVGTPFGGMLYIEIAESVPSNLSLEVEVKGVVDTPCYELGQTTAEEWKESKESAGLFAEIRTPYHRFYVPSYFVRDIEDPYYALLFWTNATALSATVMGQEGRTTSITLIFDDYIEDGSAFASIGEWICNMPTSWVKNALTYEQLMQSGSWGLIHEINHHFQTRYVSYFDEWGVGEEYFGEITNNVFNSLAYILYTNIAAYRGEDGLDDWNKVADPYSSLKQVVRYSEANVNKNPNMGDFMYSTFAHEIGPVTLANIIKSTYDGATFNGIEILAYDYKAESEGKITIKDRYDDYAYRICVASKRNYLWYMQQELNWPLSEETVRKIEAFEYEKVIPVQSVYAMGEVGRETGRAFYIPSTGYTFDFEGSIVSPGTTKVLDVSKPKYGTLTKLEDGTYSYTPSATSKEGELDEFELTVLVEADGIARETKLTCKIGLLYESVLVEHYAITKWDIYEALETLKEMSPYKTTASSGMKINAEDGNNLAKTTGYFYVKESGEYTFQAFGDDRAVFELHQEDGTTLQSLTEEYAKTVEDAYTQSNATHFTATLEANKVYAYTLIANNNGGLGWADVKIRSTEKDATWESIQSAYSNRHDVGKTTDRSFYVSTPAFVRPSKLAASDSVTIKGVSVLSTPQGVSQNDDPNSANEGDPNNLVDGTTATYFHSSYTDADRTPFPHEYIFELGKEQSFNQIELLYRKTGDDCGVIGDYEIYIADEYQGDNTKWTLLAEDHTRNLNSSAPEDIKMTLATNTARYVMVRALNNRGTYHLSILAEVTFKMNSTVNTVIGQNSSYIQYNGEWKKDTDGLFVNGATYNSKTGSFVYMIEGSETNLYVTKDTMAEVRINGGVWKKVYLTGSMNEPSLTLPMGVDGVHLVEVRAIGEELALNMISTDGTFYKGTIEGIKNELTIHGADDIEIPVNRVAAFHLLDGISYTDKLGIEGLKIEVSGEVGTPSPGSNQNYKVTYSITDCYQNTTSVERIITVTNQVPALHGLTDITIVEGEGKSFDYMAGVTATDYEDSKAKIVEVPTVQLNTLSPGKYIVEYKAQDSDGNLTVAERKITVKAKAVLPEAPEVVPESTPDTTPESTPQPKPTSGITLAEVKNLTAKTVSTSKITLSWSKVANASGYKVYRYDTSSKKYSLIKTITKRTTVSYTDSNRSSGTTYKYKVAAYYMDQISAGATISVSTKPATVKISKTTRTSEKIVLRWNKVNTASGYQIYRSTSKKGTYKKVATIKNKKTVTYTSRTIKAKQTYYYKIRAYKIVNKKPIYGAFSKVSTIKQLSKGK